MFKIFLGKNIITCSSYKLIEAFALYMVRLSFSWSLRASDGNGPNIDGRGSGWARASPSSAFGSTLTDSGIKGSGSTPMHNGCLKRF